MRLVSVRDLAFVVVLLGLAGCSKKGGGMQDGGTPDGSGATCAPGPSCTVVDTSCLGLVDNRGATTFGLRVSQLSLAYPTNLATNATGSALAGTVTLDLPACNLKGLGTFSWLLRFDTVAGTIMTGGAKPVADPLAGYAFDVESISGFAIAPVTMNATPDVSGTFAVTTAVDLNLPLFLDTTGTTAIVFPLRQARITMGTLSSSQNCIGSYNAAGLSPPSCQTDSTTTAFLNGGSFDAYIRLADADQVDLTALGVSLCVLLTGNPTAYGDGATPVAHCKKDGLGNILYQGDWCSTTNAPAATGCTDAVRFGGDFAASSVKIN